eukprot:CAMPEP_0184681618 /NCGR_PEP_ID=MMETSP0312-20130426/4611_1 /TAXON_ID=31354 /ORGANISM="Compsopogon coeruleus, Strain SAG 36.94" /LENGTH=214 /DNA_ID=CAMNT_0027132589 /DNA_START=197 /DNA_END=841 /DNA_ORIENTATION=-
MDEHGESDGSGSSGDEAVGRGCCGGVEDEVVNRLSEEFESLMRMIGGSSSGSGDSQGGITAACDGTTCGGTENGTNQTLSMEEAERLSKEFESLMRMIDWNNHGALRVPCKAWRRTECGDQCKKGKPMDKERRAARSKSRSKKPFCEMKAELLHLQRTSRLVAEMAKTYHAEKEMLLEEREQLVGENAKLKRHISQLGAHRDGEKANSSSVPVV